MIGLRFPEFYADQVICNFQHISDSLNIQWIKIFEWSSI